MTRVWFLPLLMLLLACREEQPSVNAQWGSPEYIATEFFHALYIENNLEKAKRLSTPKYADLMESYGSVRQVERTLINLSFDSVEIRVNRSGGNLREQYEDQADIELLLTGQHNGKKVDEMRVVEMIQQNGNWVVQSVKIDKFSSSAR